MAYVDKSTSKFSGYTPKNVKPSGKEGNIYSGLEKDTTYELRIAIPGLTKEDIKVDVKSGCLTVEAKKDKENEDENYIYKGLSSYEFNRSFSDLDENLKVDMESISSKYRNGLLTIELPKKKEALPREISVEVN